MNFGINKVSKTGPTAKLELYTGPVKWSGVIIKNYHDHAVETN